MPEQSVDEDEADPTLDEVLDQYDFDAFSPRDLAEMTRSEWEVAFDADSWITGEELLDRVEAELRQRVADRDVFARIERLEDGRIIAYDERDYAIVYGDGSIEGRGTVLRDVKPTVALCSMPEYEVEADHIEQPLPDPEAISAGSSELGNRMLLLLAIGFFAAGGALLLSPLLTPLEGAGGVAAIFGLIFLVVGIFMGMLVANARLSNRVRTRAFAARVREIGPEGERPAFVQSLIDGEPQSTGDNESPQHNQ